MGNELRGCCALIAACICSAAFAQECVPQWAPTDEIPAFGGERDIDVYALTKFDPDGDGPEPPRLIAGGLFDMAGETPAHNIAMWDGQSWTALGSGVDADPGEVVVYALEAFNDGMGSALYVAGWMTEAGGQPANSIAKWDGNAWAPLGAGTNRSGEIFALAEYDDGTGAFLVAGGSFTQAGGQSASRIAKWDGQSWSRLGSGVNGSVFALTVFDDGLGPAIFAAGTFTQAGGQAANRVAKWDGQSWSPLGDGLNDKVSALAVFDDGSGPALYAGGWFWSPNAHQPRYVAKWTGQEWSPLGEGMNAQVNALAVLDDKSGNGFELYAAGAFTEAGGLPAHGLAKWNGQSWSPLGEGLGATPGDVVFDTCNALTAFELDGRWTLVAAGRFTPSWGGQPSVFAARYVGCSQVYCIGDANDDRIVDFSDLNAVLVGFGSSGELGGDLNNDRIVNFEDLNIVLVAFGSACD